MKLNSNESEALVRSLDGLFDEANPEPVESVTIERRDSFNNECETGFLIVHVDYENGGWAEDAISETGSTSIWAQKV